MKKLMIAAAIVCAAAISQAAAFQWNCTTANNGVALTSLNGDGDYSAVGDNLYGNCALTYTIKTYDGATLLGETSGTMVYLKSSKIAIKGLDIAGTYTAGSTYNYEIVISGTQTDMTKYTTAEWDYSAATIETTLTGTFTAKTGTQTIASSAPSTWTVDGAVAVPEPTSGLLLLLGVAGLALKRKQK